MNYELISGIVSMIKRVLVALVLVTTVTSAIDSEAAVQAEDLDVLTRSLRFLQAPPKGDVDLAVVYDSRSASSVSDANNILDLAIAKRGPGFTLMPRLIDQEALDKLDGADLVLLAADSDGLHASVFDHARITKTLVVSLHETCIDVGLCVMWVKGTPDVRIVLNRDAAQSVNARFKTTFRMMVQER